MSRQLDPPLTLEWRPSSRGGLTAYAGHGTTVDIASREAVGVFQPWEQPAGGWLAGYNLFSGGALIPRFIDRNGVADIGTAGRFARWRHESREAAVAAAERWYAKTRASLQREGLTGLGGLGAVQRPANATPIAQLARELQVSARDAADLARQAGLTVERGVVVDRSKDGSGWDTLKAQCTPCLLNAIRAKRATLSLGLITFTDRLTGEGDA